VPKNDEHLREALTKKVRAAMQDEISVEDA